ncbi:MAG: NAD-dependent epimerase/dehydratase family protein [bacterium]
MRVTRKILVTGAAGFIGSHLTRALLWGHNTSVIGLDSFKDNYPGTIKEANIKPLHRRPNFAFIKGNVLDPSLKETLAADKFDYIYHLAATPGVRPSWGKEFDDKYTPNNITGTSRLLQACVGLPRLKKIIYASSSSVYGDQPVGTALTEELECRPISPYGVSKLTAELMCRAYTREKRVPTVSLRYFSVYGPAQRPDMGFHKFACALLNEEGFDAHKGNHQRDFTYVGDVVQANLLAQNAPDGEVFNVGGGSVVSLEQAIAILENITGKKAHPNWLENPAGNVHFTQAGLAKSREILGYNPEVGIEDGLRSQVNYLLQNRELYGL